MMALVSKNVWLTLDFKLLESGLCYANGKNGAIRFYCC
jgi:hypothetical protein